MSQFVPFSYCVAIGTVALLGGFFIGVVLRGVKARRAADGFKSEIGKLQRQLAEAAQTSGTKTPALKASPSARWTGTEVAAVVGAIGTLLGGLGTVYSNYQGRTLADQKQQLTTQATDLTFATTLLRYPMKEWKELRQLPIPANRKQEFNLDGKEVTGECHSGKSILVYDGLDPAVLHCGAGSAIVRLDGASKLLLVGESSK